MVVDGLPCLKTEDNKTCFWTSVIIRPDCLVIFLMHYVLLMSAHGYLNVLEHIVHVIVGYSLYSHIR